MQPETGKEMSQAGAINSALDLCMAKFPGVVVMGEGVPGPAGVFGTTSGLLDKYGPDRVFDTPLSGNGMTGVCIGAALSGLRPVLVQQRIEFSLLSMDQLVNNAAKWNYIFANQATVPLVVRMIIGNGSGQGMPDLQSLQTLFAHVPGLKVVMPVTPHDAKGMLISAIEDNNPVIFIEHRRLHSLTGSVPEDYYLVPLDKAQIVRHGKDVTVAAFSHMVREALQVAEQLTVQGIEVEVIDMRSVTPLDTEVVLQSIANTGRLLVADTGNLTNSIAAELIAIVVERGFSSLNMPPVRFATKPFTGSGSGDSSSEREDLSRAILSMMHELEVDAEQIEPVHKSR